MPLVHKTQPVPRSKTAIEGTAANGSASGGQEMVYKIRFTTEKFRNYTDYLERLEFYRQRIFSCRYTGRSRLTYEEALTSEFKSTQLSKLFPEALLEPMLRKLHGMQEEPEDAANILLAHLNDHFYVGESATVPQNVLTPKESDNKTEVETFVVAVDESAKTIRVSLSKPSPASAPSSSTTSSSKRGSSADDKNGDTFTVPMGRVLRKSSHSLTSEVVINKMLCVATHGNYKDAPWVLQDSMLTKLSKPPKLSVEAQKAMDSKLPKDRKKKKRKRSDDDVSNDGSSAAEKAGSSASPSEGASGATGTSSTATGSRDSRKNGASNTTGDEAAATAVGPRGGKRKKAADGSAEAASGARPKKEKVEEVPAGPKSKYPMEDLDIERTYVDPPPEQPKAVKMDLDDDIDEDYKETGDDGDDSEQSGASKLERISSPKKTFPSIDPKLLAFPPRPATDFIVPQGCLGDLLMLCSYLSAFHETLTLSPFPAEDLVMALNHPEYSSLLGEVHHRLLRHLNAHNNNLPKMSAKVWEPNLIYYLKAKLQVFGHVALYAKLKREGYFALSLPQKLQILLFVAHMVSNSRIIERPASDYPDKKLAIERAALDAMMQLRRQHKNQKANGIARGGENYMSPADLKAKLAIEEENLEMARSRLASIRTKPLGKDRYHNTYWWFGKNASRASVNPGAPNISSLEAFVLVEYHDGNIDYPSKPEDSIEDYASDEEERQEAIAYLNVAQPNINYGPMGAEDEDFAEEDEGGNEESRRHQDSIEYDHNGRPVRRSKIQAQKGMRAEEEDEDSDDEDDPREKRKESRSTCEICHLPTDLHKMLLCDVCDKAHHMYCLQPPLLKIPDGDWFCPVCSGGQLPPPPTQLPVSISTRGGQQRILEIQLAALKREEEEQKKIAEEQAREERAKEQRAQRLAAQQAADKIAMEQAAAAAAANAVASSSSSSSSTTTTTTNNTTATPATGSTASSDASSSNAMQVDSSGGASEPADSSSAPFSGPSTTSVAPNPSSNDANTSFSSNSANQMEVDGASSASAPKPSGAPRPTYNHLKPAAPRDKGTGTYMTPQVHVRWGYYETPEELVQLLAWLDERGIRERELKQNLSKKLPMITALMAKRLQQVKRVHQDIDLPTRRSTRHTQTDKTKSLASEPFMSYVNKAAETQR